MKILWFDIVDKNRTSEGSNHFKTFSLKIIGKFIFLAMDTFVSSY